MAKQPQPPTWQSYDSLADFLPKKVKSNRLLYKCFAEFIGTMFIVIFGVGSVCSAVLAQQLQGLWQVAVLWGIGISLGIYCTASISGAHLNPAVSFAFALLRPRQFPWGELAPYIFSQMLGGVIGGFVNLLVFWDFIEEYESINNIVRGRKRSVYTAMIFGEYFPNPTMNAFKTDKVKNLEFDKSLVDPWYAFLVEAWGTCILMFIILAVTDKRQKVVHPSTAPLLIGFGVACLIGVYAPITQAGWNPARDFGPRLVAVMCGWKGVAIPGPRNGFWVYILGPMLGAPIGGAIYDLMVSPGLEEEVVVD